MIASHLGPTKLILASSSPYRAQLLEKLRIPFATMSPGVDETAKAHESPAALAQRLACEKSLAIASLHRDAWVIGSDQVATLGDVRLDKPGTREQAILQLELVSGKTVTFHTAVCITHAATEHCLTEIDTCHVQFRALKQRQIERYVELEMPLDCAASFKSEGLGITLLERFIGEDPNALIGLPLIRLTRILERLGFSLP